MFRLLLFFLLCLLTIFLPKTVYGAQSKTVSFTQVITPLDPKEYKELKQVFDSAKEGKKQEQRLTQHQVKLEKYHRLILSYKLSSFDKAYVSYTHTVLAAKSSNLPTLKNTHPPG